LFLGRSDRTDIPICRSWYDVNHKNRFKKEIPNHNPHWNPEARQV